MSIPFDFHLPRVNPRIMGVSVTHLHDPKPTQIVITRTSQPAITTGSPVAHAAIAKMAGNWQMVLTDSVQRSVNLSISQSGDTVFGAGSITSGNSTEEVAAFGSVSGNKLGLKLLGLTDMNLYQLTLDLKMPHASGGYTAFNTSSNSTWTGSATGSLGA